MFLRNKEIEYFKIGIEDPVVVIFIGSIQFLLGQRQRQPVDLIRGHRTVSRH